MKKNADTINQPMSSLVNSGVRFSEIMEAIQALSRLNKIFGKEKEGQINQEMGKKKGQKYEYKTSTS